MYMCVWFVCVRCSPKTPKVGSPAQQDPRVREPKRSSSELTRIDAETCV